MKKYTVLIFTALSSLTALAQGYQVTLNAPDFKSGITYLTYYMGSNFNVADSAAMGNNGKAVFKGSSNLPPGIYSIFFPGKRQRVEFLIDKEQNITVTANDTSDLVNKTVVTGSKENILYDQYQRFAAVKGKIIQQERIAYAASVTKQDSMLHEKNFTVANNELNAYRENIIKNKPASMMAALLSAMKEPVYNYKVPVTRQDSIDNYNEYKKHYWDGITFMDDRIVRTPFFLPKLEKYYQEVIIQQPDTIIADLDYKLLLARTAPEMYKFLLNWATDEYISPKYMGLDAVFVHLFNKYHSKGLSPWLNDKQMETITRRAYMQMANLIGEKAADLNMVDSTNKPVSLYSVKAPYTVVIFWDPTCGHCKEELPHIDSLYKASWKAKGVKVYAVLTEDQKPAWVKYIKEHKLGDWINVYQTKEMADAVAKTEQPSFRQLYDVIMTPTMYLLDNDKRIIGKKLTWKQLNDLLEVKIASKQNHTKK